jgi:DNA-binding MarR family transcriptional regulator
MSKREIPKQFQEKSFRFIICNGKIAIEKEWQTNNYTWEEIAEKDGNYGIINKSGQLLIIDADDPKLSKLITANLPKTFVVQTSKIGKNHFYYKCKNITIKKKYLEDKDGTPLGDIRGDGNYYTICPPSIHPNGTQYSVIIDSPISEIDEKQIIDLLKPYFKKSKLKDTKHSLDGVKKGERDSSIFEFACKLKKDNYKYEDAKILVTEKSKNCDPPFPEKDAIKCLNSAYSYIENIEKPSLEDVYIGTAKWLYFTDTNRIDVLLATAISNQIKGTPLWMFFVGESGDGKTETAKGLTNLENIKIIDQITTNTLASGKRGAKDLGYYLQDKSTIIIILDLASLITSQKDNKREIFGQLRSLYDGDIFKDTGSGVINKKYTNCHVTLIANVTPVIRNEQLIHQQLGTRELFYDTRTEDKTLDTKLIEINKKKCKMAWENEKYEEEMKAEIKMLYSNFIKTHPIKEIKDEDIPKEIADYMYKYAEKLTILRATALIDWNKYELMGNIQKEVPTRLIKQFKRLYISLKSLDENYPDKKIKQIIKHITYSSADQIRLELVKIFDQYPDETRTVKELADRLKISFNTIKIQLCILWNAGYIDREENYNQEENRYRFEPTYIWKKHKVDINQRKLEG